MERAIWLLTPEVDLSATDPTAGSFLGLQDRIGATHQGGVPT